MDQVAQAGRRAGIVTVVGTERITPAGREIVSVVLGADGRRIGDQPKSQIDPAEEEHYVPGSGRQVFSVDGLTFGIAICHEAFRYPETVRALTLGGAQLVVVPQYVTTVDGSLPANWCAPGSPYNEKALMCRAIENTVYVAASNFAGADQGSASCVIDPGGALVAQVPYGRVGLAVADIDLDRADGRMARRYAPHRNLVGSPTVTP
jgi:predicted amidohydrolase